MLVESQFDSLPYIDKQPTDQEVEAARHLIQSEVENSASLHPKVPKDPESCLTPALKEQFELLESGKELIKGIDLTKYTDLTLDQDNNEQQFDMARVYIALEYSKSRNENLQLLSDHGKNQWLVGNDQLDQSVQLVDRELQRERERIELINQQRQYQQQNVQTTLDYLENRWGDSLKKLVDVNVACSQLQSEIDQHRGS